MTATGLDVSDCGFFIDEDRNFLGASPDGLTADGCIIEIKCPSSARSCLSLQEAVANKTINYLQLDSHNNRLKLKKSHIYMYQIQGQLHITKKKVCYFIVWTPNDMHIENILYDHKFWCNKMVNKLDTFYKEAMLPVLVHEGIIPL